MTDPEFEPTQPSKPDYEVGYGRPPKATQFKPGQSGNKKGRPKGVQNFSTVIEKELNTVVQVTENGRRKNMSKKDAIAKQLVNKAASGDIKATSLLLAEVRTQEGTARDSSLPASSSVLAPEDQKTLASVVTRLRQSVAAEEADASAVPVAAASEPGMEEPVDGRRDPGQPAGGAA